MKINGQFFEVTSLEAFALSYVSNPAKPAASSFKTAAGIQVQLASVISGVSGRFFSRPLIKNHYRIRRVFQL